MSRKAVKSFDNTGAIISWLNRNRITMSRKAIMLGEMGVGKTSILKCYATNLPVMERVRDPINYAYVEKQEDFGTQRVKVKLYGYYYIYIILYYVVLCYIILYYIIFLFKRLFLSFSSRAPSFIFLFILSLPLLSPFFLSHLFAPSVSILLSQGAFTLCCFTRPSSTAN